MLPICYATNPKCHHHLCVQGHFMSVCVCVKDFLIHTNTHIHTWETGGWGGGRETHTHTHTHERGREKSASLWQVCLKLVSHVHMHASCKHKHTHTHVCRHDKTHHMEIVGWWHCRLVTHQVGDNMEWWHSRPAAYWVPPCLNHNIRKDCLHPDN